MDGPTLSGREKKILEEIEGDLCVDARLNRVLSTMRPSRRHRALLILDRAALPAVGLLTAVSLGLVPVAVWAGSLPVLVGLVAVWVTTSVLLGWFAHRLAVRRRHAR